MLKINDIISGFKVKRCAECPDVSGVLYELIHERCKTRLYYLEREDENKTFSISFKTVPTDSTGVFHIIEHSVLCGSKKFPVKEPFVELLKGSLNTFLNALTFPDKTMYPVASRNDKDFHNLVDVYLDAVFNPLMKENEKIFMQEGWRLEVSEDGKLSTNGVVLNEMRGAYSSADEIESGEMMALLYPDSPYGLDSGGNPENITDLTYENFAKMHDKFYHPSNAIVFLDGSVDLESVLSLVNSYIEKYEYRQCNFEIPSQPPVSPEKKYIEYEINEDENKTDKSRLSLGFMAYRYNQRERAVAVGILIDSLLESNESPIKKKIIESSLCEDMDVFTCDAIMENSIGVSFRNVKDGREDELSALFFDTVRGILSSGIDKELLSASLNSAEFRMREGDYGTMPKGIIYAMAILETALYGGAPEDALSYSEMFARLRDGIDDGYFERVLSELFLENGHKASLVMLPSDTLAERRKTREEEKMDLLREKLSECGVEKKRKAFSEFSLWQKKEDTKEDLSKMPTLSISDLPTEVKKSEMQLLDIDTVTILSHKQKTNGILYSDLYFDVTDFSEEDVFDFRILSALVANLSTVNYSAIELRKVTKANLGSFDLRLSPVSKKGETKIYAVLSASALLSKSEYIPKMLSEILLSTLYSETEVIKSIICQLKIASEDSFSGAGHTMAYQRAASYVLACEAVNEYYSGYEAHTRIIALAADLDARLPALIERLQNLMKRVFVKSRLTLSVTGAENENVYREIISVFPVGQTPECRCKIKPLGIRREGIKIPAQVAYVATAADLYSLGISQNGAFNVIRTLLSYSYLWNTVRVQGGAYGSGMIYRNNGGIGFYSYRDPSPEKTLSAYLGISEFLRSFAKSDEEITRFIIGAFGDACPLLTPRLSATLESGKYLRGITYEDECCRRRELLSVDKEEISKFADLFEKITSTGAVAVVGGAEKLSLLGEKLDTVLSV